MFAPLLDLHSTGEHRFEAPVAPDKGQRMFGGQFLAQCVQAAYLTIGPDRDLHSLHAYFLRPGEVEDPVAVDVEAVRDGRGFSSRQIHAHQRGKERFRMMASFHKGFR